MPRWGSVLAATAGAVVGAVLLYGSYLTVAPLVSQESAAAEPAASSTPTPSASPTATAATEPAGCDWEALANRDRPPYVKGDADGMPRAREMTDATWECVGDGWTVEVRSAGDDAWVPGVAQALYLVAPGGDLLKLYDLRTDVAVEVLEADLDARLAWTARHSAGDGFQVVQVGLDTGDSTVEWGGSAIPDPQVGRDGTVWNVRPIGDFASGGTLWGGYSPYGDLQSLFVREAGADFTGFAAQKPLDNLIEDGAVNHRGDPGVEAWLNQEGTLAVFLAQRLDRSVKNPGSKGTGTWVVADLESDEWRVETATLPRLLCRPAPGTYAPGAYEDPGALQAVCTKGDRESVYRLSVGGDPEEVESFGP